jgi:hypothetical protein
MQGADQQKEQADVWSLNRGDTYSTVILNTFDYLWPTWYLIKNGCSTTIVRAGAGRAVAQAISRWLPTAAARIRVRGSWWTRRHWGRFSPSTSVSPANHSTNFSIIIITRDWYNRPISGRRAEWTQ